MKIKFLILFSIMIGFISCGGGGTTTSTSKDITMILNKTYIISKGQSIVKKLIFFYFIRQSKT